MLVVSGTDARADYTSSYVTKSEVIDLANPSKSCQPWAGHPTGTKFAAGAFIDSQITLCGGDTPDEQLSNNCHIITPKSSEAIVSLNVGSRNSAATEINGKVLMAGGYAGAGIGDLYGIKSTELISLDQASPGPDLPYPVYHHCIIKINNEDILLTGGVGTQAPNNG